jgi:hypothetical protein
MVGQGALADLLTTCEEFQRIWQGSLGEHTCT